jgi:WD40 repeat protein
MFAFHATPPPTNRPFQPERMGGRMPAFLASAVLDELAAMLSQAGLKQNANAPWTTPEESAPRLLILEDSQASASRWHPLARELAEGLQARGVPLYFGRFRGAPGIIHNPNGQAWPLLSLDAQRSHCFVLIFSDSQGLRQTRHLHTLRQLRGWPCLAWIELREARAWDSATAHVAACGVPVYAGNADTLRQVCAYFAAGHAGRPAVADTWHDPPAFGQRLSITVSRILAEAETWAQACAMLPPPLGLGIAQNLREQFYPHLPAAALGRLFALPEMRADDNALHFSPRLLALLRSGFACQDWALQERVLAFLHAQVMRHQPSQPGADWQWYEARLNLEINPDSALPRLRELVARADIGAQVRADLARVVMPLKAGAGSTARIPLRKKPHSRQGMRLLLQLAPDCGLSYAEFQPLRYHFNQIFDRVRTYFRDSPVCAQIHPDGQWIVSVAADNSAALWHAGHKNPRQLVDECSEDNTLPWQRLRNPGKLLCCFYADGTRALTVSHDNCVRVWDIHSGEAVYILKHHALALRGLALSATGQVLGLNGDGQIWDILKGRPLLRLSGHRRIFNSLAIAPDNRCLLTASADGSARLWETHSGQLLQVLRGHRGSVEDAAFSPDGRFVITAASDATAVLWETHSGKCLQQLRGHRSGLTQALFAPDGSTLLTAARDGHVCLWRSDGQLLQVLEGHRHALTSISFSADGQRILSADASGDIRLWDRLSPPKNGTYSKP